MFAPAPACADDLLQWHSENVQLLHGSNYELGDVDRTIVTLEHANSWAYGDTFAFVDLTFVDDNSLYGELSPRLSLSRISGQDLSWGPIKDVLIAGTYEFGDEGYEAYLIGGAVDLNVPGFTFPIRMSVKEVDNQQNIGGRCLTISVHIQVRRR